MKNVFTIGTKVAVISDNFKQGHVGVVVSHLQASNRIGVKFRGLQNPWNTEGLYYCHPDELAIVEPDNNLNIKKIIFNGSKTIILWEDGSKTIATCGEGDHYDRYAGFCAAITKKLFGTTSKAKKVLNRYSNEVDKND